MNHPREPFERLLDVFDEALKRAAARHGFVFDPGTHQVTRAIRIEDDRLKRGVFLDLKEHWMKADPVDPVVVIHCGAWSSSHVLIKPVHEGRLSEAAGSIDAVLERAIQEVMPVSEDVVDQDGTPCPRAKG